MLKLKSFLCYLVLLSLAFPLGNAWAKKPRFNKDLVSAITLDVVKMEACASGKGCVTASGPMQLDLLELADGKVDFANQVLLPEKTQYLQLMFGENSTITVDDELFPLSVPGGTKSGLKLKGRKAFGKEGGFLTSLELQFKLGKKIVAQRNKIRSKDKGQRQQVSYVYSYKLKPVIRVESAEITPMTEDTPAVVAMPDEDKEITIGDKFSLVIPAGAVSAPMVIAVKETKYTVEVLDEETGEMVEKPALASNYKLSPDGAEFNEPLQVVIPYHPDVLPSDVSEYDLAVYLDGERIPTDINTISKTATADVWHFTGATVSYEGRQIQMQMPIVFQDWNFGWRFMGDEGDFFHPATDLNAAGDDSIENPVPVTAIAEGKVVANSSGWGGIVIEHLIGGKKYYSQYGHIKHLADQTKLVSGKSTVKKGQQIGYIWNVGSTVKNSFTPHLHFEIRNSFHPHPTNASFWVGQDNSAILEDRKEVFKSYESPLALVRSYEKPDKTVIIVEDSVTYSGISRDIAYNKVVGDGKIIKERFFEPDNLVEWPNDVLAKNGFSKAAWDSYVAGTGENRGFGGNYHYAPTVSGSETSAGKWYFDIPQAGNYRIYASIPVGHGTTEKANYEIFHNNQVNHVVINQNIVNGSWQQRWRELGVFDFISGNNHYVKLGNNTGETGKHVAFDAIKLVLVGSSDDPEPTCLSRNGLYCGSVDSSLDVDTLYSCQDGTYQEHEPCSYGCEVTPSSEDDRCMPEPTICPSGDGLYCGGTVSRDANTLYRCTNGVYSVEEQCSDGCQTMPVGQEDQCREVQVSCPDGNGSYCGDSSLGQNTNFLYYCQDGNYQEKEKCSYRCEVTPSNEDDRCMPEPATCPSGTGSYCGDSSLDQNTNYLYYCQNGNYGVQEMCANGCETMPASMSDRCKDIASPVVDYVEPPEAALEETTTFIVNGKDLPDTLEFILTDCTGVQSLGGSSTARKFSCTPRTAEQKEGRIELSGGAVLKRFTVDVIEEAVASPVVYSVTPTEAALEETTTFTVNGENLPSTLEFLLTDCTGVQSLGGSSTARRFSCTPRIKTGQKDGKIEQSGGSVLKTFTVDFL
ncbi:Peptidase family M23 [Candidatus Electrothrix aarhusensis]|uniref:Peptidase family M23 n=1 Tax=Candidatus Electrothrix aarhusensis TaxID=1859131 RepID=A0A3S3QG00_9BACT|nr:Peptidase family M23 [Candidatus Electrothrix aarhusensis]